MVGKAGDSDKVEVPKDAFLRRTSQLWKLIVGALVLPLPTALWGWWCLRSIRADQPTSEAVGGLVVLVAGALIHREPLGVRAVPKVPRAPCREDSAGARGGRRDHIIPEGAFVSLLRLHSGGEPKDGALMLFSRQQHWASFMKTWCL